MLTDNIILNIEFIKPRLRRLLICGALLVCTAWQAATAQTSTPEDDGAIENTEIVIEKNKKISFPELKRNFEKISPKKNNAATPDAQKYEYKEPALAIPDLDPKIKIATIKDELLLKVPSNYIRGGFGNYTTTYIEGQIFTKPNEKYMLGAMVKHLASGSGPVDNSGNSLNLLGVNAKYFLKKSTLSAEASFKRTGVNFYGYDHAQTIDPNTIQQAYSQFNIKTDWQKVDSSTANSYKVSAQYNYLFDKYTVAEGEFSTGFSANYNIPGVGKLSLQSSLSLASRKDSTKISRTLFNIRPEYEHQLLENLSIRGGFNIAIENDTNTANNAKHFHVYPVLHGEYRALPKLTVFAGLDGGMEKVLLRTLVDQNPYIATGLSLLHTNKKFEVYGGLKGNLTNYLVFSTSPSLSSYQNLYYFINSPGDSSKFTVLYDPSTAQVFKFTNELAYEKSQKFKIGLRSVFYNYSLQGSISGAWHRPTFETTVYGNYNLYGKLAFGLDIFYISGIKALNPTSQREYQLPGILDINLTAKYKISERLAVFLNFYNILSNNYQRYNYYANKGINVVGGLTFTF